MLKKYSDLDENACDALREIGNIGTGNAVSSLSQMTGKRLDIDIPAIQIVSYQEAPALLGGVEVEQVGILLELSGEIKGIFMFLLNEEFTKIMLESLLGEGAEDMTKLGELEQSAICEIGNIMCCSYINALSRMMDIHIQVSVPSMCCDMVGAILSVPMIRFANMGEELMFIENKFRFNDVSFVSHILFLPELDSLDSFLQSLGV